MPDNLVELKKALFDEFEENDCLFHWNQQWDKPFITMDYILHACHRSVKDKRKDMIHSGTTQRFIDMVDSWG
jgi:hypothetical protein